MEPLDHYAGGGWELFHDLWRIRRRRACAEPLTSVKEDTSSRHGRLSPVCGERKGEMSAYGREASFPLTAQEKNVLRLVAEAQTNKEIAASLGISLSTVKRHLENIFYKLHVQNRVGAALYAERVVKDKEKEVA